MAAIASLAVSLGLIRLNTDSPAHRFHADLLVDFPSTTAPERDGNLLAPQDWQARLNELTSPAVLDAALTDAYLSTLPRLYGASDPPGEFRRMLHVQGDHRAGVVRIRIEGHVPAEPMLAANPLAEAIISKGPPGARVARSQNPMRMPLSPALLDRRWKVAAVAFVGILTMIAILFVPARSERPS
jgi:hypothetical protein